MERILLWLLGSTPAREDVCVRFGAIDPLNDHRFGAGIVAWS